MVPTRQEHVDNGMAPDWHRQEGKGNNSVAKEVTGEKENS
jgi:hypothetical protein